MTCEEKVKTKWPDAEISQAFAVQPDKTRRWMYCVMSSLKFIASRGKKKRVTNVGNWRFSEADAWADAERIISAEKEKDNADSSSDGIAVQHGKKGTNGLVHL